jgi:hypothetical protein
MFGRYGNTGGSGGSGSSGSGISDAEKKDFNEISTLTTEPTPANFKNGITVIKYNDKLYVLNDAGEVTSVGEDQCIGFFDKYGDLPNDTTGEFKNKLAFVREQDGARRAGVYIGMGKNLAWIAQYNFLTRDEHVIATVDDNYEHYGNGMGKKRYAISDFGDLMEATTSSLDPSTNSNLIEPTNDWGYAITNNIADHFTGLGAIKKGFRLTASTDKKINFDIGTVYAFIRGENRIMSTIIHGKDNALFTVINQAGIVTDSTDIINVEDWDNGGRNETLSANACTFSTFYLNYKTKKLYQLIGQKVYSTKEEALNNYRFETRLTPAVIENDTICLGGVITSASDTIIDSSYIIHSNKLGEIIELNGGGATASTSGYNRMFLSLSSLNPTDPEAPTKQEIKDVMGDTKGVLLYYTGTDNADDSPKFIYMIDDNKEITVIEKPIKDGVIVGYTDSFPDAKDYKNDYFVLTKSIDSFDKGIYKSDGVNWLFAVGLFDNADYWKPNFKYDSNQMFTVRVGMSDGEFSDGMTVVPSKLYLAHYDSDTLSSSSLSVDELSKMSTVLSDKGVISNHGGNLPAPDKIKEHKNKYFVLGRKTGKTYKGIYYSDGTNLLPALTDMSNGDPWVAGTFYPRDQLFTFSTNATDAVFANGGEVEAGKVYLAHYMAKEKSGGVIDTAEIAKM